MSDYFLDPAKVPDKAVKHEQSVFSTIGGKLFTTDSIELSIGRAGGNTGAGMVTHRVCRMTVESQPMYTGGSECL